VKAKSCERNQWLLVNIQDVTEFACQVLNRDVWRNQTVKDIVQSNFVFWQVFEVYLFQFDECHFLQSYIDTGEGKRVCAYYNIQHFPYVAILDPRTGEMLKQIHTNDASVVADMCTFIYKYIFINILLCFLFQ
jgi:hypothetical protein